MKKLYFLLFTILVTTFGFSQSTGDIAFIGFNADGDDNFAIVALADIPANTTIYFSDDELNGSGGFVDSNEGNIQWITPASVISAGTVVTFTDTDSGANAGFAASVGTISYVGSGTVNLAGGGDALFAYLGSDQDTPTIFLAGIQNTTSASDYGDLTGSGLTIGSTFVIFPASGTPDGGEYSGPRDSETIFSNYLTLIGNSGNWTTEDTDGTLILPFDTTAFVESAVATPIITVGAAVNGLNYFEGNGPSDEDTFSVAGSNLTEDITVNAPTNFELSLVSGGPYSASVILPETSGTVATTDVFVILSAGLSANTYNGNATASSTGATNETVSLEGTVLPADPQISTSGSISDLEYVVGSGPSTDDSFSVSALFLGDNLVVTAPADFEVSLTTGSGFADSVTIMPDGNGEIMSTDIFVRMKSGLTVGPYSGNVVASSTGATDRTEAVNGIVNPSATCAPVGSIIITEIMQNPNTIDDSDGEYFEVYNTTASSIDLIGWEIVDLTNSNENFTITSSVVVAPGGYAVLGVNSDTGVNGGITIDYDYPNNFFLGNGSDEISIQCSSTVIDEVSWDDGATFPDPNGSSMELSSTALNSIDNDNGANWGEATTAYDANNNGTPGTANDFSLSTNSLETNRFSIYPNPTSTGEVKINSVNSGMMDVAVYDILGKQVKRETISNSLDVSNLRSGVYILKITQNEATSTKKLVIR